MMDQKGLVVKGIETPFAILLEEDLRRRKAAKEAAAKKRQKKMAKKAIAEAERAVNRVPWTREARKEANRLVRKAERLARETGIVLSLSLEEYYKDLLKREAAFKAKAEKARKKAEMKACIRRLREATPKNRPFEALLRGH